MKNNIRIPKKEFGFVSRAKFNMQMENNKKINQIKIELEKNNILLQKENIQLREENENLKKRVADLTKKTTKKKTKKESEDK